MNYYSIHNWEQFQHYKNRNPPWIKLHRSILTDYNFACLQDASKLHLMLLWLYASQHDNKIPADTLFLRRILQIEGEPDLEELERNGFIQLIKENAASKLLAECKQNAPPVEKSREDITSNSDESGDLSFSGFWELYPRKDKKKDAEKVWKRLSKVKQAKALKDIRTRFEGTDRKFIPLPPSYLNSERWDDESAEKSNSLFDEPGAV